MKTRARERETNIRFRLAEAKYQRRSASIIIRTVMHINLTFCVKIYFQHPMKLISLSLSLLLFCYSGSWDLNGVHRNHYPATKFRETQCARSTATRATTVTVQRAHTRIINKYCTKRTAKK